jgi:hypothetical protein
MFTKYIHIKYEIFHEYFCRQQNIQRGAFHVQNVYQDGAYDSDVENVYLSISFRGAVREHILLYLHNVLVHGSRIPSFLLTYGATIFTVYRRYKITHPQTSHG